MGPLNVKENNPHGLISTFLSDGICRVTVLVAALFPAYQPLSVAVSFCVIFRVVLGLYRLFKNVYCFSDFLSLIMMCFGQIWTDLDLDFGLNNQPFGGAKRRTKHMY